MKKWIGILALLVFIFNAGMGIAEAQYDVPQETEAVEAGEEELNLDDFPSYAYGTVVSLSGDTLVLREYDLAADADVEVTYKLDPAIEMENINSLSEIAAGDDVDLDYIEEDGSKVAVYIAKEVIETE